MTPSGCGRRGWSGVIGALACMGAAVGSTATAEPTPLQRQDTVAQDTIPVARGKPSDDLAGEQGSRRYPGEFEPCTKKGHRISALDVTAEETSAGPIPSPSASQIAPLYESAFGQCFMTDFADRSPEPKHQRGPQAEVAQFSGVSVQFRAVARAYEFDPRTLKPNTGYVAGDYKNVSANDGQFAAYPIAPGHSALLIVGRGRSMNDDGLYRAIVDFAGFPTTATPPSRNPFVVLEVRKLNPKVGEELKVPNAFARFHDPHAIRHDATPRFAMFASEWFGCGPGCCQAGDVIMFMRGGKRQYRSRR
jgi:hypothetical protein